VRFFTLIQSLSVRCDKVRRGASTPSLKAHVAGCAEEIGADLALFDGDGEDALRSMHSNRSRWALRIDSGKDRRSSPLSARISKGC
jgi:hypothetical protein